MSPEWGDIIKTNFFSTEAQSTQRGTETNNFALCRALLHTRVPYRKLRFACIRLCRISHLRRYLKHRIATVICLGMYFL